MRRQFLANVMRMEWCIVTELIRLIYLLLNDTWRSIKFYFRTQLSVASSRFRESYSSLAMLSIIPAFRYSTNCLGIQFREILQRCTCRIMNTSFQLINSWLVIDTRKNSIRTDWNYRHFKFLFARMFYISDEVNLNLNMWIRYDES